MKSAIQAALRFAGFVERRVPGHVSLGMVAIVLTGLPCVALAEPPVTLVFGVYTSDKPSAMVTQLRPTVVGISQVASRIYGAEIAFEFQVAKNYKEGVDRIVAGRFDVMRLGPASYVLAKERAPGVVILAMENNGGKTSFNGVIAVHRDSPIRTVADLRGKRFAFGSSQSTLGRYFSQLHLMRGGVLAKDLQHFEYLGRHDKVGAAVGAGLFDAGALEGTTFDAQQKKGTPIRALLTFPNATRPWIAKGTLDPKLVEALRQAMLSFKELAALRPLRFDGFLPGSDADYEATRTAIRENGKFFEGFSGTAKANSNRTTTGG